MHYANMSTPEERRLNKFAYNLQSNDSREELPLNVVTLLVVKKPAEPTKHQQNKGMRGRNAMKSM